MYQESNLSFRERLAEFIAPALRERRDNLERIANTDRLTGLANRNAFEKALPKARREGLAFIVFDLNNYGKVNKKFGFAEGDNLLKYFAGVIGLVAAKFKARAMRLGGDEFVIIGLPRFAETVRSAVEKRAGEKCFDGFTVSISGSAGRSLEDADSRLQERKNVKKRGA